MSPYICWTKLKLFYAGLTLCFLSMTPLLHNNLANRKPDKIRRGWRPRAHHSDLSLVFNKLSVSDDLRSGESRLVETTMATTRERVKLPIDAVITYVNGSDPAFQSQLAEAVQSITGGKLLKNAATMNRFADHDDLRILLRSIDRFGQLFRRIFLVVAGPSQVPHWLKNASSSLRLKVVFHSDIWRNSSQLPVFNSLAIEANLHHIPDLSEHFVYFNDDLVLLQEFRLSDILAVAPDGVSPTLRVLPGNTVPDDEPKAEERHWVGPTAVTRDAIEEVCSERLFQLVAYDKVPGHGPHFLMKSILLKAETDPELAALFSGTSASKLRSGNELNTVQLFNAYAQCKFGVPAVEDDKSGMVYIGFDESVISHKTFLRIRRQLMRLREKLPEMKFLCLNDITESEKRTESGIKMAAFAYKWRESLFPYKSEFEL